VVLSTGEDSVRRTEVSARCAHDEVPGWDAADALKLKDFVIPPEPMRFETRRRRSHARSCFIRSQMSVLTLSLPLIRDIMRVALWGTFKRAEICAGLDCIERNEVGQIPTPNVLKLGRRLVRVL
jgi:hypothetical protein